MYESITGSLKSREPASAVVEAGGIGYRVHISLSTYEALPSAGKSATLLLHLVVRDDEWRLYGFAAEEERETFRALLRVSGVGPVMALSLLSGFQPAEFRAAVAGEDIRGLTRVKGVGKKTAERIVVELRDVFRDGGLAGTPAAALAAGGPVEDAVRALESLGLDGNEARKRVAKHQKDAGDDIDAATLIRRALRG